MTKIEQACIVTYRFIKKLHDFCISVFSFLLIAFICWVIFIALTKEGRKVEDYPIDVQKVIKELDLTDEGLKSLLKNNIYFHSERSTVQNVCSRRSLHTTFGCYFSNRKIHVFNNKIKEIEGITPVVLAHELLHSVYHDLSYDEKDMFRKEILKLPINTTILDKVKLYNENVKFEELYSFIATEQLKLSPSLERHYGRYFKNRKKVVKTFQKSESVKLSLKKQILHLNRKIASSSINLKKLDSTSNELKNKITLLSRKVETGSNKRISTLNKMILKFNSDIKSYKKMVNSHNELVKERNKKVEYLNSIIKKIKNNRETASH